MPPAARLEVEPEIELNMARRTCIVRAAEEGRGQHSAILSRIDVIEQVRKLRGDLEVVA